MKTVLFTPVRFATRCLVWMLSKMFGAIPALAVVFLWLASFTFAVTGILACICLLTLPFVILIDIVLNFTH